MKKKSIKAMHGSTCLSPQHSKAALGYTEILSRRKEKQGRGRERGGKEINGREKGKDKSLWTVSGCWERENLFP